MRQPPSPGPGPESRTTSSPRSEDALATDGGRIRPPIRIGRQRQSTCGKGCIGQVRASTRRAQSEHVRSVRCLHIATRGRTWEYVGYAVHVRLRCECEELHKYRRDRRSRSRNEHKRGIWPGPIWVLIKRRGGGAERGVCLGLVA
eukprot:scaffold3185_cov111-Isochrysis_galbana.AAC.2